MRGAERIFQVSFESAEALQREYEANLVHGGVFVPTEETAEPRERVQVEFLLAYSGDHFTMTGEVVHVVTSEMAEMGAIAGVAVQFDCSAREVQERIEPLCAPSGTPMRRPVDLGRRRAPRARARLAAQIGGKAGDVAGQTRDLSRSGVLVSVAGKGIPVGEKVRLSLTRPASGDSLEVDGVVVREIQGDGGVSGLGIAFEPRDDERADLRRFVDEVQSAEHTRRLGGVAGGIAEFGIQNLLQMFAITMPEGTLTLQRDQQEGVIGFESGMLCFVRLGAISGRKALVRLLSWTEGRFELHASLDSLEEREAPVPVDAAVFDAMRLLDEEALIDRSGLHEDAKPRIAEADLEAGDLGKLEETVLDLVRAGFTVGRMIEVIPEPDPEIYRALISLCERGVISL
jgi:Tfp pilus assembly protein PilZ